MGAQVWRTAGVRQAHVYPGVYDLAVSRRDADGLQPIATREGVMIPDGLTVEDIEFAVDE